jgi:hypothetical protein
MRDRTTSSVWTHKPWWCQPWSILLTGISLIAGSWLVFHRYWLTGLIGLPVTVWMGFFLLVYPKLAVGADAPADGLDMPTLQNQPKL